MVRTANIDGGGGGSTVWPVLRVDDHPLSTVGTRRGFVGSAARRPRPRCAGEGAQRIGAGGCAHLWAFQRAVCCGVNLPSNGHSDVPLRCAAAVQAEVCRSRRQH